jgi:hypothetical protein
MDKQFLNLYFDDYTLNRPFFDTTRVIFVGERVSLAWYVLGYD